MKSVTDMSNAKMQIKQCLIEVKDTPAGQKLKDKVDGVPEKIDGGMKEWEDFSDWQYADLGTIKKKCGSQIDEINLALSTMRVLMH